MQLCLNPIPVGQITCGKCFSTIHDHSRGDDTDCFELCEIERGGERARLAGKDQVKGFGRRGVAGEDEMFDLAAEVASERT